MTNIQNNCQPKKTHAKYTGMVSIIYDESYTLVSYYNENIQCACVILIIDVNKL